MKRFVQFLVLFIACMPLGNVYAQITVSETHANVMCFGGNTGSIDITTTGGISPYTYLWNGGSSAEDRTNLIAGNYSVTITDNTGNTATLSVAITEPTTMTINGNIQQPSCFGGNNGSVTITSVAGSTGPYSFAWAHGPTTQSITGLSAGNYTVTVTSSTSCTTVSTLTVGEPTLLTVSLTPISVTCNGGNNGAINTTRSGGTGPYTYLWNNGAFTQNRTGLATGTYSLTVTDLRGCTATASTFVSQPALALTIIATPSPLACIGGPSGSVISSVSGGTSPYSYWWGGVFTSQNRINVPSGNYCVTATDANGCTANGCAIVPAYTPLQASFTQIDVICSNDSTGSIDLTVTDGTTPYTYLWNNSANSQDISNLAQGTYIVTVTDNRSCTISKTITITEPAFPLSVNTTVADVSCYGKNDGSITLNPINGTSPYSYSWGGGEISQSITGLLPGNYSVTITDNSGCSISSTAYVAEPTQLVVVPSSINVACYGNSTGAINLTATGSFAPYAYDWNDGGDTQNRDNIPAGNYSVLLTDLHGCTAAASATISQPLAPLAVTATKEDVACSGASTGWININASGGTFPYSFNWGGIPSQNRTNLAAGNYDVVVTDSAGCTSSASTTINQPFPIAISSAVTNVACNAASNGSINLNVTGGMPPYTYDWGGGFNTPNRVNLTSGSYTVTVTDSAGCTDTHTAIIFQTSTLSVSASSTDASCNAGNNATITVNVTGGALPYNFIWNDGTTTTQNRSGINAGDYSVTVTDANICTASATLTITEPSPIITSTAITNPVCFGLSTGSIDLTVSGGTGNYIFSWSNSAITQDINSLAAGNYLVNITDANNCVTSTTATVIQPSQITLITTQTNISCNNLNSGSIDLTVNGGTLPFTYAWNNSMTTEDISLLTAGNYSVTVNDNNLCSATTSVNIAPTALTINEIYTNVSCNGMNDGSITVNASGGTSPYTYDWNGLIIQNRTSLSPGVYSLTVTDNTTCSGSASITITEPALLVLSETHNSYACANNTGSVDLAVAGGTSPYNYTWAHGPVTQDVNNLSSGNYSVVVSDANSCSSSVSVNITALAPITSSFTKTDLVCNGTNIGTIDLTVNGGTLPYSYMWSNNAVSQDLSGLAAGNYTVVITDANNCTVTNSVVLTQPNSIQVSNLVVPVKCYGDSSGTINISVNGGTSPYYFAWNNLSATEDIFSLRAGNYSVTVTDQNGCYVSSNNITVSQPARLNVAPVAIPVSCIGRSNGEINLLVSGGTTPYRYNWSNQLTSSNIRNLNTGNYMATVTDINSCSVSTTQSIGIVPEIAITSLAQNTACDQVKTGAIDITMTGGTPPYRFNWSNSSNTEDLSQLASGNYAVSVTDSRDCSIQENFNLTSNYSLQVEATESTEINLGESIQLTVTANVDHGNMYLWRSENDLACSSCATTIANPAFTTHYTVDVTDTNGCQASDELTLTVNSITDIFIPNAFTPNDDGNNDVLELYGNKGSITFLNFSLFNRWGEKVIESNDPNFKWDGTYKGEKVSSGVYLYVMKVAFVNGYSRDDFKGSITVLR